VSDCSHTPCPGPSRKSVIHLEMISHDFTMQEQTERETVDMKFNEAYLEPLEVLGMQFSRAVVSFPFLSATTIQDYFYHSVQACTIPP
jgi:hypothetical protein